MAPVRVTRLAPSFLGKCSTRRSHSQTFGAREPCATGLAVAAVAVGSLGMAGVGILEFGILPAVDEELKFEVSSEPAFDGITCGKYLILPGHEHLDAIRSLHGRDVGLESFLGPLHSVTMPSKSRRRAGIPEEAQSYAFAYPLERFENDIESRHGTELRDRQRWVNFALCGGFAYFDGEMNLVRMNALTLLPTSLYLKTEGPYDASLDVASELHRQGRMSKVTLDSLEADGMEFFCWMNPSERPGGHELSEEADWQHGAFVYQRRGGAYIFYRVEPSRRIDSETDFEKIRDALDNPTELFSLLHHEKLNIDAIDETGYTDCYTALMFACERGMVQSAEILISEGA